MGLWWFSIEHHCKMNFFIKIFQQACYANDELYQIMKTGSATYASCQDGRGEYPTGGTMGKAFCLFDKLGLVSTGSGISFQKLKVFRNEVGSKSSFIVLENMSFWLQRLSDPALLRWDYLQKKSTQPLKSYLLRAHFLSKHFTETLDMPFLDKWVIWL